MIDFIVVAILAVVLGSALAYMIRSRKNGITCIGCPDAKNCASLDHAGKTVSGCGHDCGACTGCSCHTDTK